MAFTNHAPRKHVNPIREPIVKKKQHPNIVAIFEKFYKVRLNSRDIISLQEQRELGVIATGDKRIDSALSKQTQNAYVTINDMVEYFRDGISFFLTDEGDSKKIFEAVTAHTSEWRAALRYSYNMGNSPVEDLILLENFASGIYVHARFEYEKRPEYNAATGTLAAFLYSKHALPGVMYFDGARQQARGDMEDPTRRVKEFKHEPNVDIFQNALMQNMGNLRS